jgi:hypothetical protein
MTVYHIIKNTCGRWIIVNGRDCDLAWSGSCWVEHSDGFGIGRAQISNFSTKQDAEEAAHEQIDSFVSGEPIRYIERVYTRDIVNFLITQRDQVATTTKVADQFMVSEGCARRALERLQKVRRVDEFFPNMWHLE